MYLEAAVKLTGREPNLHLPALRCREPGPHLAFGYGRHVCVAQWLARAELQVALATLLRRLPNLQLDGPVGEVVQFSPPHKDIGIAAMRVKW